MPTEIINRSYYDAADKGRQDRQNYQTNALNQENVRQGMNQQNILNQRYDANDQAAKAKQFAEQVVTATQYVGQVPAGQRKQFIEKNFPFLVETYGPGWQTATDEQVSSELGGIAAKFGSKIGVGPAQPQEPGPLESYIDPKTGQPVFGTRREALGNRPYDKPPAVVQQFTPVQTDTGIGAFNSRTGTVAPTGVKPPDKTVQPTAAERKAKLEAKVKLPRVDAAVRRAQRLADAVASIGNNSVLTGGPVSGKALQYTDQGREVMAAAAQLTPELQALTRVPGIGSQSDLEARLASLALPSLEMDANTNARSMAELQAFIQDLKTAYEVMANGGEAPEEAGPAAVAPSAGPTLDDIRRKYGR